MSDTPKLLELEAPGFKCLDHGIVQLCDHMGDDLRSAQIAQKSFRATERRSKEDEERITRYLVKNRHTTPIEFNEVVLFIKMPIFVERQLVRHRTASIEGISLRYVRAVREFYVPKLDRMQKQHTTKKQGSAEELIEYPKIAQDGIIRICNAAFDEYENQIKHGLSNELARIVLPLGTYTEWYWKCDLHNTLHMLGLRLDSHAQYEIRVYADAILALCEPIWPTIIGAWKEKMNEVPDLLAKVKELEAELEQLRQ